MSFCQANLGGNLTVFIGSTVQSYGLTKQPAGEAGGREDSSSACGTAMLGDVVGNPKSHGGVLHRSLRLLHVDTGSGTRLGVGIGATLCRVRSGGGELTAGAVLLDDEL